MTTRQAAQHLNTTVANLLSGICNSRFAAPPKDPHGYYSWGAADLERARLALAIDRRYKPAASAEEVPVVG